MAVSPPIRLLDYFVEHLDFDVLGDRAASAPAELTPYHNLGIDVAYSDPSSPSADESAATNVEHMTCRVTVHLNRGEDLPAEVCYRGSVRLVGLFERQRRETLDQPPPEDEYLIHCIASVVSTLYGTARDTFVGLSAASPFPKVVLPSISPYAVAKDMLGDSA